MRRLLPLVISLGVLTVFSIPVEGFHGTPWIVHGSAVFEPTGERWGLTLSWSTPVYRAVLSDPATDLPLVVMTFQGYEQVPVREFTGAVHCPGPLLEVVYPHSGQGLGPSGTLTFTGVQENCLANGSRYLHMEGLVVPLWTFDASFGTPFGTQYE